MIEILIYNIIPVFAVMALGFLLGQINFVSNTEATTLNRIAFLILQPALIFPLVANANFNEFYVESIALYGLAQAIIFLISFYIGFFIFSCSLIEAWLIAMATVFVNSLLYIFPISKLIYGVEGNIPITAIVVWDATFTFAFFIITTDLLANKKVSFTKTFLRLAKNPVLVTIVLALFTNFGKFSIPEPILTAFDFVGAGAAPLTLFALGVILSSHGIQLTTRITVFTTIKLFGLPIIVLTLLQIGERPNLWNDMLLLNSAGPSGAMAFALALLYNTKTDIIAPVIIWTSILTLFSLAWLA